MGSSKLRHSLHTDCSDTGIEEQKIDNIAGHTKALITAKYGKKRH